MRVLGLDVGDARIGVARSDETATLASGLETLKRVGPVKDVKAIATLVRTNEIREVVVGMPRRLDGELGPQALKVQAFMEALKAALRIPVVAWDERFTTALASRALLEGDLSRAERKKVVDKVSAVLILQSYLDSLKSRNGGMARE